MRRTYRPAAPARRTVVALLAAATVLLVGALPAAAGESAADSGAGGGRSLTVDAVDATGPTVQVQGVLTGAAPSTISVASDGTKVAPRSAEPLDPRGARTETVVVLDNSASLGNAAVQLAKNGMEPFLPGAGTTAQTAVVATGGGATIRSGMSGSSTQVAEAIDGVQPFGTSALWDSLVRAADLFAGADGTGLRQVVVFAAGADTASKATPSVAVAALRRAGAQVRVVALPGGLDLGSVQNLVASVGGTLVVGQQSDQIVEGERALATAVQNRFLLTLPAAGEQGTLVPLALRSGEAGTEVAYEPGKVTAGADALAPVVTGGGLSARLASLPGMKVLLALLGAAAVALLVWAVLSTVVPDPDALGNRLGAYDPQPADDEEERDTSVASTALLRRAVQVTGEVAERRGILESTELKLEHAAIPLRAAEALFLQVAAIFLVFMLVLVSTKNVLLALVGGALAFMVPNAVIARKVRQRQKAFQAQLPDMLALLSGTLRAGYSIAQGFEAVSREIDDPMGRELRRVVTESRLGRPLEDALESVAERMDSVDFAWAVMAIRIQREVGGNLAELLMTVSETMTQRERLRRDVLSLTAEGRMSAMVLGFLPPALGMVMWVMNPEYIARLFTPGLGFALLGLSVVAMLIGFAWMKKIITVEV
ncbi:MAG: type II secretion system F family protein [Actinomycetes bacterium]